MTQGPTQYKRGTTTNNKFNEILAIPTRRLSVS